PASGSGPGQRPAPTAARPWRRGDSANRSSVLRGSPPGRYARSGRSRDPGRLRNVLWGDSVGSPTGDSAATRNLARGAPACAVFSGVPASPPTETRWGGAEFRPGSNGSAALQENSGRAACTGPARELG